MKTFSPTPKDINHEWFVVDAQDQVLGRLASQIAHRLRGKHKPEYTPNVDCGDFVIVLNAAEAVLTGKKGEQKFYRHHSGWTGGLKETKYRILMQEKPEFAMEIAVKGMMPKNSLGASALRRLRVYRGAEHNHAAQTPEVYEG